MPVFPADKYSRILTMNFKRFTAAGLLIFSLLFSLPVVATQLLPLPLKEISQRSELIFRGRCEKKISESVTHPKSGKEIPVTVYFFSTQEVVKGEAGSKMEVRQLAVRSSREAYSLGIYGPFGGVSLDVGKEYLLFLGAPSSLGVRSVIGGSGGKFSITKNHEGKEVVSSASNTQTIPYGEFLSSVRKNLE